MGTRSKTVSPDDVMTPATRAKARELATAQSVLYGPQTAIGQLVAVENVLTDMMVLVGRGDGWMRWGADKDGKTLYMKYKFTSYRYPNHYVFVSGPIYDVAMLVAALLRKCERVDDGSLVPTLDRAYDHP